MSTNFYWFKKERKETPVQKGLLIGKLKYGYVFHFKVHSKKALISYLQWKEFTKTGYIYNGLGNLIPYDRFWEIVADSKEEIQGSQPLVSLEEADYISNGFMFTEGSF